MRTVFKAKPTYRPAVRQIHTPAIPATVAIKPKRAVRIPTIHSKAPVVVRPPSPKVQRPAPSSVKRTKPVGVKPQPVAVVRPAVKKRTLTTVRPSHLKRAHDKIMGKHIDKIRSLRGSGQGRLLVILACGPSVNQAAIDKLKHPKVDVMCINKPEARVWPSQFWMFCDQSQYNRNKEYWADYKGTIINASSVRATHPNQILIRTIAGKGFSRDMTKGLHIGRSTTYSAMQVALYMGYNKVYIFGCDMGSVDGQMHRYGQNPDVSNENRARRFDKEAEHFAWGTNSMKDYERVKFVFCSTYNKYDFIKHYDTLDQKVAVDEILVKGDELMTKKELELAKI